MSRARVMTPPAAWLVLAALLGSCAPATGVMATGGRISMQDGAPASAGGAEQGGDKTSSAPPDFGEFVLVPRQVGDNAGPVRGNTPLESAAGDSLAGANPSVAPQPTASPVQASPVSCLDAQTAPLAIYTVGDDVLAASRNGLFRLEGGNWSPPLGKPFPCGTVPAALARGSAGAIWAAAPDGIWALSPQTQAWTRAATGDRLVDLDLTPDASAGIAIQEDGVPFMFDGQTWAPQRKSATESIRLQSQMGGARILSATEAYAIGLTRESETVIGKWDGQAWTLMDNPPAGSPPAGLAVRRTGAPALVVTTRSGLYRLGPSGWASELGPLAGRYLGIPAFGGEFGFVADLALAGGRAYAYAAGTWTELPDGLPDLVETTAFTAGENALALGADGESLYLLPRGGAWRPIDGP